MQAVDDALAAAELPIRELTVAAGAEGVVSVFGVTEADPDFAGKVLVVTVKEPAQGAVLQKARVQRLGGRAFIVGEYVKRADDDPNPAEVMWFPVDDILLIREFKSVEEVRKMYAAQGK